MMNKKYSKSSSLHVFKSTLKGPSCKKIGTEPSPSSSRLCNRTKSTSFHTWSKKGWPLLLWIWFKILNKSFHLPSKPPISNWLLKSATKSTLHSTGNFWVMKPSNKESTKPTNWQTKNLKTLTNLTFYILYKPIPKNCKKCKNS